MSQRISICGVGFLGTAIARRMLEVKKPLWRVQLISRNPTRVHDALTKSLPPDLAERLDPPRSLDITMPGTLHSAFDSSDVVVSAVGILQGTPADFVCVQLKGAENVARAAHTAGAKLIHFSAIGANPESHIPYARTKGLAEQAVFATCDDATIVRPSIIFGPGDGFFGRFAQLSKFLPFMPVFGGGHSLFQPVFIGDIARLVEIICKHDPVVAVLVDGEIIEAGGPDVLTYREVMELVLKHTGRWRPIIPVPFAVAKIQAAILEKLPPSILTLTRDQIEQLKEDNIVNNTPRDDFCDFKHLIEEHSGAKLTSVHEILPSYLPQM